MPMNHELSIIGVTLSDPYSAATLCGGVTDLYQIQGYRELAPSDDEIPVEDQPLPADASPTALSPSYVSDFDPLEEDPEEDPADYPTVDSKNLLDRVSNAQSVGSSNTDVLDSPCLLVLINQTLKAEQPGRGIR
ncbi:hypothetical protein Tco_1446876 [Tanacetum coccineum]